MFFQRLEVITLYVDSCNSTCIQVLFDYLFTQISTNVTAPLVRTGERVIMKSMALPVIVGMDMEESCVKLVCSPTIL